MRSPLPRRRSLRCVCLVAIAALQYSLVLPAAAGASLPSGTPSGYSVAGIDVSAYDGTVDWQTVEASGASFAYVRSSEQEGLPDVSRPVSYAGGKAQGLLVGA